MLSMPRALQFNMRSTPKMNLWFNFFFNECFWDVQSLLATWFWTMTVICGETREHSAEWNGNIWENAELQETGMRERRESESREETTSTSPLLPSKHTMDGKTIKEKVELSSSLYHLEEKYIRSKLMSPPLQCWLSWRLKAEREEKCTSIEHEPTKRREGKWIESLRYARYWKVIHWRVERENSRSLIARGKKL